jgi:hypothetical protein
VNINHIKLGLKELAKSRIEPAPHEPWQWSGRCDCRNGHNSSSGRCTRRDVVDLTATEHASAVRCAECKTSCTYTYVK